MSDPLKVHEALVLVMRDVQAVGKDGRNTSQGDGFSFRGVDATVNAVGPALRTHGVLALPDVISAEYETFTTRNGALMHQCILHVRFTFVGPAGDQLTCSVMGEAADSGDKSTAKAHSVALRTALLEAWCIPTDDPDPDATSYERTAAPEMIPSAEAKTRLIAASDTETAKALWKRPDEPISVVALDALLDVARAMKEHETKAAAAVPEGGES